MIKAMVFDFGQTLVDSSEGFRAAEKEAQQKASAALGFASAEAILPVYREIRSRRHGRSNFSRKEILGELLRRYGRPADSAPLEQWETDYWRTVQAGTRPFPEAKGVLEALLAKGYRLALITNTQGQTAAGGHRLSNYPELELLFETIIVAGEGGIPPKPDPAPFLLGLEKLGIAPGEAVYVGDDWRIDIQGAGAVGMHPVWLRHRTVSRNWPAVETAVPVIDNLEALLDMEALLREGTG